MGREVVRSDSYDYSSQYGERRRGRGHGGGYSTGSEYDTTGTWGGNTTQYSQSEARNQSEYPSSGESERKDRYHPFDNNDGENYNSDSDTVTEMTDMGHHGKERRRRRDVDRYQNQDIDSDEETSSSENEEREHSPSDSSDDDDEDRDGDESDDRDDPDPNLRKAFSEPLDTYRTHHHRFTKGDHRVPRGFDPVSSPRRKHRDDRKPNANGGTKPSYYKGMDQVHLQQVDEEAYELYADLETKGTLSPQNSLQVLLSRSRSRSRSPPTSPASNSECPPPNALLSTSGSAPTPTPEKSIDVVKSSSGIAVTSSHGENSNVAKSSSVFAPTSSHGEDIDASRISRVTEKPPHSGESEENVGSGTGSSRVVTSPELFTFNSSDERVGEVVLQKTLSGQSMELISRPYESNASGQSVEFNRSRSADRHDAVQMNSCELELGEAGPSFGSKVILAQSQEGDVPPTSDMSESQFVPLSQNRKESDHVTGPGAEVAWTQDAQGAIDVNRSREEAERMGGRLLDEKRLSPFQRSLLKRELAPTPETGPRALTSGPLFQSQYHYVQEGLYKAASSNPSRRNSKSTSLGRSRSHSPGAHVDVPQDNTGSFKSTSSKQTKRGPSPEIPETHTLTLLQHNTNSFETGITNTESRLAVRQLGKVGDAVLLNTTKQNIELNHTTSHTNCDSLIAQGSYTDVKPLAVVESPTKKYRDGEDLRVTVDDQSVEASRLHLPEEKMAQSILNERIKKALAKGTSPTVRESFHFNQEDNSPTPRTRLEKSHSLTSAGGSRTLGGATLGTVSEALSDIEDVDLYFVQQYEMAFDVFMQQNITLMAKNPVLVYNLRVAKLQQMLQVTADVEAALKEQIVIKQDEKRQMLDTYKKQLVEAARRKAALETHLRHQLSIIEQATVALKGKLTWQTIESNNKRAKRHYEILQRLSREKQSPMVLLYRLPKETVSAELRDVISAPASSTFSEQQERELQQLQVDTTFLKAEVKVLERSLAAEQAKAKTFAWVDSLLIRMDPTHLHRLKRRYQKKLGTALD